MGWLKKAAKKVKGAVKTATGGRTKIGKFVRKAVGNVTDKGLGAFTAGQISGSDRAGLLANRAAVEQEAADKVATEQKALEDAKAKAAAEEAARYKGQVSVGVQAADTAGANQAGGPQDPNVLAAQEEERKRKLLEAAQRTNRPRTILG